MDDEISYCSDHSNSRSLSEFKEEKPDYAEQESDELEDEIQEDSVPVSKGKHFKDILFP